MGRALLLILVAATLGFPGAALAACPAWPHDSTENVWVCSGAGGEPNPVALADGAGGAFLVWTDGRSGAGTDIYAQHLDAYGRARWTAGGVPVCAAPFNQFRPRAVLDGAGGIVVAWQDQRSGSQYDIYAQRLDSLGAPRWIPNGVAVCTAGNDQGLPALATDGAGGAIVAWGDARGVGLSHVYAQRLGPDGAPQWTANGMAVCGAAGPQSGPAVVPDGAGGAIVAWQDGRVQLHTLICAQRLSPSGALRWAAAGVPAMATPGTASPPVLDADGTGGAVAAWMDFRNGKDYDILGQRFDSLGAVRWGPDGAGVCTAAQDQAGPTVAADRAGGAVVAWHDYRSAASLQIRAQRISPGGAPRWTPDGILLCGPGSSQAAVAVSDGASGAVVAWQDGRGGAWDVYAQHVDSAGTPQWQPGGVAVCTAQGGQSSLGLASDGAGGAIAVWVDSRSWVGNDLYAQRVERFGYLGNPEPCATGVRDVPADQGGWAELSWERSYLDTLPGAVVQSYEVWRKVPPTPTAVPAAARRAGRALAGYWEPVASVPAAAQESYTLAVPTGRDSMLGPNPLTLFRVEAHTLGEAFWASAPDSGYSVDNLPPVTPQGLRGIAAGGFVTLRWHPNPDPDVAVYRLYRGATSDFVPDRANRVCNQPDTVFADRPARRFCYKLSATDIHGNEGPCALLLDSEIVSVPAPAAASGFSLGRPWPNPARARAQVRLELPEAGPAELALFDAEGRRLRTLLSGAASPGPREVALELRGGAGQPLPCGIYWLRLSIPGRHLVRKLVVLR